MILVYITIFLISAAILLLASQYFVKYAEKVAQFFRISPLVVGTTIVAIGTTLPEQAVTGMAILQKDLGLAMGNIMGSNIVNVLLVFAVGIMIGGLRIGTTKTQRNSFILLSVSVLFFCVSNFLASPLIGVLLIFCAVAFTITEYYWGLKGRDKEDFTRIHNQVQIGWRFKDMVGLLASLLGIVICGSLVVLSVERISILSGYSTTILGLSITAIATSLPELITAILSQRYHQEKITEGNIFGSNVYNMLLLGGFVLIFTSGIELSKGLSVDWIFFLVTAVIFFIIITLFKGKTVPRSVGVFLFSLFILYLFTLQFTKV